MSKLTLEDFHTFYLGSFMASNLRIMRDNEVEKFIEEIERFTKKLLSATRTAICIELNFSASQNNEIIEQVHGPLKEFKVACDQGKVPLNCAAQIFRKGTWATMYGGAPWAEITRTASCIENSIPVTHKTIGNLMVQVDHLIDLWHNTARYLDPYVDFDLTGFLDVKSSDYEADNFTEASRFMKGLYTRWGVGRNVIKSGRK